MLIRNQSTEPYETVMRLAVHLPNGQTAFRCPRHGYMWGDAVQPPQHSCEYCWVMWFLKLESVTPPDKREELMDNLTREMTLAVRLAERGEFDIQIDRHPKVEVTLDPADFSTPAKTRP